MKLTRTGGSTSSLSRIFQGRDTLDSIHVILRYWSFCCPSEWEVARVDGVTRVTVGWVLGHSWEKVLFNIINNFPDVSVLAQSKGHPLHLQVTYCTYPAVSIMKCVANTMGFVALLMARTATATHSIPSMITITAGRRRRNYSTVRCRMPPTEG